MRLIDCFSDAISTTLAYTGAIHHGVMPDYDEVRIGIEEVLSANANYSAGGFTREQYDLAKFAVVAFIDEVILLSEWDHRHKWAHELLQKSHFTTSNAGEEFFERLDGLSSFDPGERDVREVYVYCLALGFVGKFFRPGDRARLDEIRNANLKVLRDSDDFAAITGERPLFPGARGDADGGEPPPPPQPRRTALIYGVPLLLLLAAYAYFRVDLLWAGEYLVTVL
jgi:type VI secretion system protein ImpK